MAGPIKTIENVPVLICGSDGAKINSENDATELIGEAFGAGVEWVVVPVERLTVDFFELKTRVAGGIVQKFVNYRLHLVILGDVLPYTSTSQSFHDFVFESNRG